MTALYNITRDSEFSGATIYLDGETYTVSDSHPSWTEIVGHLLDNVDDDAALLGLVHPAQGAGNALTKLSERVSYGAGTIYFDGDPLESAVADHIIRIVREEGSDSTSYAALVGFLEKVSTNPSKKSRKHLYDFIQANGMTIDDNGDLIAYKGVTSDLLSTRSGYGIVNGEVFESAQLKNEIGNVVEIPRSMVDDDQNTACSTGLHVGAYGYARGFSSVLIRVRVNPRDVVAVPRDSGARKVRVCRYEVIDVNSEQVETPTYHYSAEDDDDEFDEVWEDEEDSEDEDVESEAPAAPARESRVDEYKAVIPTLIKDGISLKHYRSKRVTAGRRDEFAEAARQLGFDLD